MGKIVSGITDAVGLTNTKGEKRAAEVADKAFSASTAMSKESIEFAKEQLDFQKEQYNDWKGIYGDIQENLGDYYKNLMPDKLVALGLENQQREFQAVQDSIKRDFAQRGLKNSGEEIAVTSENAFRNASAKAAIRTSGDKMVADEKLSFLGIGLGQGANLLGNINNSAGAVTNAYGTGVSASGNVGNSYLNRSTTIGSNNQQAISDAIASAAYVAKTASDARLKENIEYLGEEKGHKTYSFNYKGQKQRYKGIMAQDVIEYAPEAVEEINGFMFVDYSRLGVTMEKI